MIIVRSPLRIKPAPYYRDMRDTCDGKMIALYSRHERHGE
jgi:hypothetical protein